MPICGSLPVPPNYREDRLPNGQCILVFAPLNPVGQTYYQQGTFVSTNPNALVTVQQTDAAGRQTLTVGTAARGTIGTICTKNCGAGTGFFGLGGGAAEIARTVGSVIAKIAPALTPAAPFLAVGSTLAENVERSQTNMALNLSGILGAVGNVLGGANLGDYSVLGQISGAGLNIASAALAPSAPAVQYSPYPIAAQVSAPVYGPVAPAQPAMQAQPVGAFGVSSSAVARLVAPILLKIATKLGYKRLPTLRRVITMVRKMAKFLMSPEAVAAALGITAAELASLIVADNQRKRRRMNPANAKALRRAATRIKSFHRLCQHTDLIKSHRRSAPRYMGASCGTCRSRPCKCK